MKRFQLWNDLLILFVFAFVSVADSLFGMNSADSVVAEYERYVLSLDSIEFHYVEVRNSGDIHGHVKRQGASIWQIQKAPAKGLDRSLSTFELYGHNGKGAIYRSQGELSDRITSKLNPGDDDYRALPWHDKRPVVLPESFSQPGGSGRRRNDLRSVRSRHRHRHDLLLRLEQCQFCRQF
jgi:hypothetical protein